MTRITFCLPIGVCFVLPCTLLAQRAFPSPSIRLHDLPFKAAPTPAQSLSLDKLFIVDGRSVAIPSTSTQINSLVFSPDGKLLAAGKEHGRLVVWNIATQQVLSVIDTGFPSVGRVAVSPDNQFIAAAVKSGPAVKIWHIAGGEPVVTVQNTHANVLQLFYAQPKLLILFSGSTYGFDTSSGELVKQLDESTPLLSADGNTLVTIKKSDIVVRSIHEFSVERTVPKVVPSERPVFWDTARGTFLYEDTTDDHVIVAARTTDGQLLPDAKLANLPKSTLGFYDFGAIDPGTGLVFGHTAGQLWALDLKTGKTCLSPQMLSNGAALSADGKLLAGAIEPGTPTDNQKDAGINIWRTDDLAKACHMQ